MKKSSYILLGQAIAVFAAIPLLMISGKQSGNTVESIDSDESCLDTCIDISGQPFNIISIEYDSEVLTEQIRTSCYYSAGFDISEISVIYTDTVTEPQLRTVSRSGWSLSALIDGATLKLFVRDMTDDADYDYSPDDSIIITVPRSYTLKRIVSDIVCPSLTIGNAELPAIDIGIYGTLNINESQIDDLTLLRGFSRDASTIALEQSQLKTLEIGPDQNHVTLTADSTSAIGRLLWLTADTDTYYNLLSIDSLSHPCEMIVGPGVTVSTPLPITVYNSPEIETSKK